MTKWLVIAGFLYCVLAAVGTLLKKQKVLQVAVIVFAMAFTVGGVATWWLERPSKDATDGEDTATSETAEGTTSEETADGETAEGTTGEETTSGEEVASSEETTSGEEAASSEETTSNETVDNATSNETVVKTLLKGVILSTLLGLLVSVGIMCLLEKLENGEVYLFTIAKGVFSFASGGFGYSTIGWISLGLLGIVEVFQPMFEAKGISPFLRENDDPEGGPLAIIGLGSGLQGADNSTTTTKVGEATFKDASEYRASRESHDAVDEDNATVPEDTAPCDDDEPDTAAHDTTPAPATVLDPVAAYSANKPPVKDPGKIGGGILGFLKRDSKPKKPKKSKNAT